jgi:uncharacterized protein YcsI (UPF0317 family)
MIITTSATTVTTVTYLNLYDLENYKKQFQSFWIPFMEQFIPATTIWVAGERWCNDVCTIIDPCDYDFELVESEITITQVESDGDNFTGLPLLETQQPVEESGVIFIERPIGDLRNTKESGIYDITDLGSVKQERIILTESESMIDMVQYRNKFTGEQIETILR